MDIKGFKAWAESKKLSTDGETGRNYSYTFYDSKTQAAWYAWQAKAQAVPEGFVLVNKKDLLELTIAINAVDLATHTESKTNEVREMWQQVALKLMALGISQEQSHECQNP